MGHDVKYVFKFCPYSSRYFAHKWVTGLLFVYLMGNCDMENRANVEEIGIKKLKLQKFRFIIVLSNAKAPIFFKKTPLICTAILDKIYALSF